MKRLSFAVVALLAVLLLRADPVLQHEALVKAVRFLAAHRKGQAAQQTLALAKRQPRRQTPASPPTVAPTTDDASAAYYVFNIEAGGGFVIVGGDDRLPAVLGYADSGAFTPDSLPPNMEAWLGQWEEEAVTLPSSTSRSAPFRVPTVRHSVAPLLTTTWDQNDPYNRLLLDKSKYKNVCYTGCVATAMAQLLCYHARETGQPRCTTADIPAYTTYSGIDMPALPPTTFEYDKMVDYYSSLGDYYNEEQLEAVHKILKYAGCALEMQYSSGGSSSTFDVERISKYFGYRDDAKLLHAALFPRHTWEDMIYNELAAGRPVPYNAGAVMAQNHSFIIDGYDGRGYFHANTGEFGYFGAQFYCKLHVINDCETQTGPVEFSGYNCYQSAIFNFQPQNSSQPLQTLSAEENMDGKESKIVVNGVHFYNPYLYGRTVAIVDISNVGETYENYLFLWQGETLKGGVGTYVPPGESGEVVICIGNYETGIIPVRFTTDWDGKDVVYETTLEVTEQPEWKLTGYFTHEGYKGLYWINEEVSEFPYPYWTWDTDWKGERGIYEQLKVEADITNTSENRFNSWISSRLYEQDPEGGVYSYQGKALVEHFYYVDLAPGETTHLTFFFDKHLFNPEKMYDFNVDYNGHTGVSFFSLPFYSKYFPSSPEGIEGILTDTDDTPTFNLQGIPMKKDSRGVHIRKGGKYVVK